MNTPDTQNWLDQCDALGVDPDEVERVSERFDMYREYTEKKTGTHLPLERWYSWYRVEKLSEGHAMTTPPVQDCSVAPEADAGPGQVVGEADFLAVLQNYRRQQPAD